MPSDANPHAAETGPSAAPPEPGIDPVRSSSLWHHLPNALTLLRLLLGPAILIFIILGRTQYAWFAIALAALTDLLDGVLARALKAETAWGRKLDPIADKVVVTSALIPMVTAYVGQWAMPGILIFSAAATIIARDWLIELLRWANPQKAARLAPIFLAKLKTWVEYTALLIIYGVSGMGQVSAFLGANGLQSGMLVLLVAALLSVVTGLYYLWQILRSAGGLSDRPNSVR